MQIDTVYYINLSHRTDRRAQVEAELSKLSWTATRIEADYVPERGALGCARSQIKALRTFLESKFNTALVLEDDIVFTLDPKAQLEQFFHDHPTEDDWDILMLASNMLNWQEYKPYALRVIDAQTASAYVVTRRFAAILLDHWLACLPRFDNRSLGWPECDMSWKELMPHHKWFSLQPRPAMQKPGYSDIEKKLVDYGGV